jgi:hypothetical protein
MDMIDWVSSSATLDRSLGSLRSPFQDPGLVSNHVSIFSPHKLSWFVHHLLFQDKNRTQFESSNGLAPGAVEEQSPHQAFLCRYPREQTHLPVQLNVIVIQEWTGDSRWDKVVEVRDSWASITAAVMLCNGVQINNELHGTTSLT